MTLRMEHATRKLGMAGVAQQMTCASEMLSSDIPLAAWGGMLATIAGSSSPTVEELLRAWVDLKTSASPHLQADPEQKLYLTYIAATTSVISRKDAGMRHCSRQVIQGFGTMVAAGGHWSCAISVLDQTVAIIQSAVDVDDYCVLDDIAQECHARQLRMNCAMVKCLLDKATIAGTSPGNSDPSQATSGPQQVLQHGFTALQTVLFPVASSQSIDGRACVMHALLPVLVQTALQLGEACRRELSAALWGACSTALVGSSSNSGSHAVVLMVRAVQVLLPSHLGKNLKEVKCDPAFWHTLQELTTESDALARKRGRFLLQHAIQGAAEQEGWQALLRLLGLLEDFAQHLIRDAWPAQLTIVHTAAVQSTLEATDGSVTEKTGLDLGCCWLVCLWKRAFDHPNPQVQRYVLQSLLELQWPSASISALPVSFIVVNVLNTFCQGCLTGSTDATALTAFLQQYVCSLCTDRKLLFMKSLLHCINSNRLVKAAQLLLLESAEAVAAEVSKDVAQQAITLEWHQQILMCLKDIVKTALATGSRQRQLQLCHGVLRIAKLLLPADVLQLSYRASLLADLPALLFYPSGPLTQCVTEWCLPGGVLPQYNSEALLHMFEAYFSTDSTTGPRVLAPNAVSCVHMLLVLEQSVSEGSLSSIVRLLGERINWLGTRSYLPPDVPLKTLILLSTLLQATEAGYHKDATTQMQSQLLRKLPSFICDMVPYLGDYALRCAAVFQSHPDLLHDPQATSQVARAISEAPPSRLSPELQSAIQLAHTAVDAICSSCRILGTLLASDVGSSTTSLQRQATETLDQLVRVLVSFVSSVTHQQGTAQDDMSQAACAELRSEQLLVLAQCCHALCPLAEHAVQGTQLLQKAGQLVSTLVQTHAHESNLASVALSCLQSASWQALYPLLTLLCCASSHDMPQDLSAATIAKAVAEAETVPSAALVPLLRATGVALKQAAITPKVATAAVNLLSHGISNSVQQAPEYPQRDAENNCPHDLAAEDNSPHGSASASHQHAANLAEIVSVTSNACWQAIEEEDRLRPEQYEAFLQVFLMPELFTATGPAEKRRLMHGDQGPMKKLVQKLLLTGKLNTRLASAVVLHLSQLFICCPAVALFYEDGLLHLMLGDTGKSEMVGEVQNQGTDIFGSSTLRDQLSKVDPALAEALSNFELSPRITTVCLMHHLAAVAKGTSADMTRPIHDVADAGTLGQSLWQQLLSKAQKDPSLSATNYQINSAIHRAKVRAWQALAVLSAFIPLDPASTENAIDQIWPYMQSKEVSSIRQYLESILVNLALRDPCSFMQARLLPALQCYHHKQHEGITSAMLIGCQLVRHAPQKLQHEMLGPLVAAMWPWTMWHHHAIRTLSQLVLHHLLEEFPEALQSTVSSDPAAHLSASSVSPWHACLRFFRCNPDMQRLERSMGPGLSQYSPAQAIAPLAVFQKGSHLAGEGGVGVERAPETLLEGITTFLMQQRASLRAETQIVLADRVSSLNTGQSHTSQFAVGTDFQRKMMPVDQLLASARDIAGAEGLVDLMQPQHDEAKRQDLIVVASLIDKIPNLAGLTRTCEVFRAAALVVSDMNIIKDPMFASISVTAEQWVPFTEVKMHSLRQWMAQKKVEGYVLVGLEQTAESVSLTQFRFAAKSILLLGREREGIPPDLLEVLDHTVEIPQLGLIRSLNVHVSGAIAMYEYSRQQ